MPSSALSRHLLLAAPLLLAGAALPACGSDSGSTGSATKVAVAADDDSCAVADTALRAGGTTFAVTNNGSKVTEVYVYAEKDGAFTKIVGEVEDIGPGTSRDLDVELAAGSYQVACKPGQRGDGIRADVTVSGAGGGSPSPSGAGATAAYDRELELTIADAGLTGLDPATADKGERLELTLHNTTDGTRTLELLDPAGKVATEFDVPAGADGEAVVEVASTGDWTVKVEGGSADVQQTLTVR